MARPRRRVMLEAGPRIDLRRLRLRPHSRISARYQYCCGLDVSVTAELGERWGAMILEYEGRRQTIHLEGMPRPFGGVQWFAWCPVAHRRALVLWQPNGSPIFASRRAWPGQVCYATQLEDACGRAWSAKRRVARRLGSRDPDDYDLRPRPKGMRRHTYQQLKDRYWAAEARLDDHLYRAMAGIMRRYGRIDF